MTSEAASSVTAIDLFCGAGGLTCGLRQGGIDVVAGVDIDPLSKFAFEENNPGAKFVHRSVEDLNKTELDELWGSASKRLLAGCAPCQPFSTYSQGKNHATDNRWRLLDEFSRLVKETLPDHVTMENVPSLAKTSVFHDFVGALQKLKYNVWYGVVNCVEIGLPQARFRLVLLASLGAVGQPQLVIKPRKRVLVKDALNGLPSLKAGQKHHRDPVHRCASLSEKNLERIRTSVPGGTWKDWPKDLRTNCHRKESGDGYLAVYGRMELENVAPTITTQCYNYGSGRFGHPTQDRAISLREAAVLQGFPKSYKFENPRGQMTTRDLSRLIGNAVPPPLGKAIAETILAVKRYEKKQSKSTNAEV